jgi:probable rRNA maturation factor
MKAPRIKAMGDVVILSVDLRIEDDNWEKEMENVQDLVENALSAAADHMGMSGLVEVLLTDNSAMHELNKKWRGNDKPTDVLSFPAGDSGIPGVQPFFGDIALGLEVAKQDAIRLGRDFQLHVMHLLVHGFLHLLGYDHMSETEAEEMEGLEAEILSPLGLPNPYGD